VAALLVIIIEMVLMEVQVGAQVQVIKVVRPEMER
jgi:hypothetical protein